MFWYLLLAISSMKSLGIGGERSVARGLKCLQKFKTQGLNLAGAQALSFTWEVQVAAVHLQGGITEQLHSFLHRQ